MISVVSTGMPDTAPCYFEGNEWESVILLNLAVVHSTGSPTLWFADIEVTWR